MEKRQEESAEESFPLLLREIEKRGLFSEAPVLRVEMLSGKGKRYAIYAKGESIINPEVFRKMQKNGDTATESVYAVCAGAPADVPETVKKQLLLFDKSNVNTVESVPEGEFVEVWRELYYKEPPPAVFRKIRHTLSEKEQKYAEEFISAHREEVRKYFREHLKGNSDCERDECESEVWLILCRNIEKFMIHPAPEKWLSVTKKNVLYHCLRAKKKNEENTVSGFYEDFEEECPSETFCFEDLPFSEMQASGDAEKKLRSALSRLTENEKRLFELRYIQKRGYSEIAKVLSRTPDGVRAARSKQKRKIEGLMKSDES